MTSEKGEEDYGLNVAFDSRCLMSAGSSMPEGRTRK